LRRLEEMTLRREHAELLKERDQIDRLLADQRLQWKTVTAQIRDLTKDFGRATALGRRRTRFEAAPQTDDIDLTSAMIVREPITVVITQKGWIRSLKGHTTDLSGLTFKGDDGLRVSFLCETTSKILVLAGDGKVFTLDSSRLPGGRGHGEPIRLMADIDEAAEIAAVLPYDAGTRMLVAAADGRGFLVNQDEMISSTRKGRMVLNVSPGAAARLIVKAEGDHVACIGENRKLLIFPVAQIPEMTRGKGVRLQRYKDGGISDALVFSLSAGLVWHDAAGRTFRVDKSQLRDWLGTRAEAGRLPPKGFPKNNRFG
jgi:topoisomerase IV subunit A